jgi:Fur family ferric uptake transcriptional regulator
MPAILPDRARGVPGRVRSLDWSPTSDYRKEGSSVTPAVPGTSRNTRQRVQILSMLDEANDFQSAQRVYHELRNRGAKVGLTTVYRTLQMLADADEVDTMRLPTGEQLYRRCSRPSHHHHLVCRECGNTIEITGPAIEQWADAVADEHGFIEVSHTIDIFGVCPKCARPRTSPRRHTDD